MRAIPPNPVPLLFAAIILGGCASLISNVTGGMASNLSAAILNQDDPETVRDGAPAYLLMLDSFIEGSPDDAAMLGAAAELYSAYGVVFTDDPERASRLTTRARDYGQRALCAAEPDTCGLDALPYGDFVTRLEVVNRKGVGALYSYGLAWIAYIKVHAGDSRALTKLPRVTAILERVNAIDPQYKQVKIEHYLAILNTVRPPALGGDFESGRAHYERAISLSQGHDLSIHVDYATFYARTLYDRDLHDRLLEEVLAADPVQDGNTLFNTIAQRQAEALLASADEYF